MANSSFSFARFRAGVLCGKLDLTAAYEIAGIDPRAVSAYLRFDIRSTLLQKWFFGLFITGVVLVFGTTFVALLTPLELRHSQLLGVVIIALHGLGFVFVLVAMFLLAGVALWSKRHKDAHAFSWEALSAVQEFCELTGCRTPSIRNHTKKQAREALVNRAAAIHIIENAAPAIDAVGWSGKEIAEDGRKWVSDVFKQMQLLGVFPQDMALESLYDTARDKPFTA